MQDLAGRVAKLEQDNRRLKLGGLAVAAVLVAVPLVGAVLPQEVPTVMMPQQASQQWGITETDDGKPIIIANSRNENLRLGIMCAYNIVPEARYMVVLSFPDGGYFRNRDVVIEWPPFRRGGKPETASYNFTVRDNELTLVRFDAEVFVARLAARSGELRIRVNSREGNVETGIFDISRSDDTKGLERLPCYGSF